MTGAVWAVAVLVLQSPAESAAGTEAAIQAELAGLEAAWRAGALEAAHERAGAAVRLIEASACPLRGDAAIAAALGGLSAAAGHGEGGVLFWVADQVDQRLSVLPAALATLAADRRSEPGEAPGHDDYFIRSAYLDPDALTPGCAEAQLDADIAFAEPADAEAVILAVRWPHDYSAPRWRWADFVFAYPNAEGRALFEALEDRRSTHSVNRGVDIRIFDPCLALPGPDYEYFELCREGAAP